ncbi:thap domain protein [Holotrichia oblita]|uniref:Thap domain protein n=1 Tax=Holotrichia oblita TaxID=644536 RepID=A0ACB9SK57_HOLOL|nr:thap domain protein [Holotrichia oblita]
MNKRGSHVNCCVYGCHSMKGKNRHLSFHSFPKKDTGCVYITNKFGIQEKVDRKKAWEIKLLMGKRTSTFMRVCSLHFNKDDFFLPDVECKFPRLKRNAIPSQNLPLKSVKEVSSKLRKQHEIRKKIMTTQQSLIVADITDGNTIATEKPCALLQEKEKVVVEGLLKLITLQKTSEDKGVQVKSGDIISSLAATIESDAKLSSLTGLPNLQVLDELVDLIKSHFPDARIHNLTVKERIIVTFMKMKTGLRYVVIASLFRSVSSQSCKLIFHDIISKLAVILKLVIVWPTLEECQRSLPICFKNFSNVRVIVDCTEITVQRSKNLCCRIFTYSHYKGTQTIKFMIGVSPAGLITFISKAYGGRASDKAIFEQSGIIDMLDMHKDAIMVDKGFRIEHLTDAHFIKLIRPPFLKKKIQLSKEEAHENVDIARARVHIERVNQRIKVFEILIKPLPLSLVPKIDEIFTVICAVVNLSVPILSDDKFLT